MLLYRIAHLACILAAATLCAGAAVEPRGDIRYDQPGSNLKEASISHLSVPGRNGVVSKDRRWNSDSISHSSSPSHNGGVTKDRRWYSDGRTPDTGALGGAAPRGGCSGC